MKDYSRYPMKLWKIPEALEALDECLQKYSTPARLDYEELGGLSDPRQWDCPRAQNVLE